MKTNHYRINCLRRGTDSEIVDLFWIEKILKPQKHLLYINPKTAGRRSIWPPHHHHCGFLKNVFFKERVKPMFSLTLNVVIKRIFPENFIEITQVAQKLWRIFLSILAIFIDFHHLFGFFDFLKLVPSAYNKWCQHFFTFNIH